MSDPLGVTLTPDAAAMVRSLLEEHGPGAPTMRLAVQPSSSGLRFQAFFDERSLDGDTLMSDQGVSIIVDRMSRPYLTGAVLGLTDGGFTVSLG